MATRVIKTWRDPYAEGFSTCRPRQIEINSGLTVLVGCNGAGKSTLLHNIKDELEKAAIPYMFFDNQQDGDHHSLFGEAIENGEFSYIATSMCSSEGENITININRLLSSIKNFLINGKSPEMLRKEKWASFFNDSEQVKKIRSKERWFLLDAIDSGYSIDNVLELKTLLNCVLQESEKRGLTTYILISANEYELANGEQCFDVMNGKYTTFADYNAFRKFILYTRKKKEARFCKKRS